MRVGKDWPPMTNTCDYVLTPPATWSGKENGENYVTKNELNRENKWTCPHDAIRTIDDDDLCIFHLPVSVKADDEVVDAFFDKLKLAANSNDSEGQKENQQFIGAKFGEFRLDNRPLTGSSNYAINFKHATFNETFGEIQEVESDLLMNGATFKDRVDFKNTCFKGRADFRGTYFEDWADFTDAHFKYRADFRISEFTNWAYFERADFDTDLLFRSAKMGYIAQFNDVTVTQRADFRDTEFIDEAYFRGAKFHQVADFRGAKFYRYVDVRGVDFIGDAKFQDVCFKSVAYFPDVTFFSNTKFRRIRVKKLANFRDITVREEGSADFQDAIFENEARFVDAEIEESTFKEARFENLANFTDAVLSDTVFPDVVFNDEALFSCTFEDEVDFSNASLGNDFKIEGATFEQPPKFNNADLTNATLTGIDLRRANLEGAQMSRATLFGTDLRWAYLSGAVINDVRINNETKFLGRPDGHNNNDDDDDSGYTIRSIRKIPVCVYDPEFDETETDRSKAKSFYHAIEELSGRSARPKLQAHCSIRRKDLERLQYKEDVCRFKENACRFGQKRILASLKLRLSGIGRKTMLYGESPWRIIVTGMSIIFLFGILYSVTSGVAIRTNRPTHTFDFIQKIFNMFNLGPISPPKTLEILLVNMYFSIVTFTTLGYGDIQPAGPETQALAGLESLLGAALIALLVFVLGRRSAR